MAHSIPLIPGCARCLYFTDSKDSPSWLSKCGHPLKRGIAVHVSEGQVTRCTGYKPADPQLYLPF